MVLPRVTSLPPGQISGKGRVLLRLRGTRKVVRPTVSERKYARRPPIGVCHCDFTR